MLGELAGALAVVLLVAGLAQFGFAIVIGHRERRSGTSRDTILRLVDAVGGGSDLELYFLVPCLNEATVIVGTVRRLLRHPDSRVVVIDDGSDDDTVERASAAGGDRVLIVRRRLPDARQGKSRALNVGLRRVVADVHARGLDPGDVVVCVMDGDGRLSEGATAAALNLFRDPTVGGVQLPVRISNRTSFLARLQDFEFWGVTALAQLARGRTGSVSLGGNGQFTRLAALLDLGELPWGDSLTEDLDLTVSLIVDGWRLESTPNGFVEQEAVHDLRRLLRQRTRWLQGHLHASRRIPEIWASRRSDTVATLELTVYLLTPALILLPWSLLSSAAFLRAAQTIVTGSVPAVTDDPTTSFILVVGSWYLASMVSFLIAGEVYRRARRGDVTVGEMLVLAHAAVPYSFVMYLGVWVAVLRVLRGRYDWVKTERDPGRLAPGPSAPAGAR